MNVLVTGATSMIGRAIVDELVDDPEIEIVFVIIRRDTNRFDRIPQSPKIRIIWCNIDSYLSLPSMVREKCDVFYHIAWSATGKNRNDNISEQIKNVQYTLDALYAAKTLGCHTFIGAGSQAEYGVLNVDKISPILSSIQYSLMALQSMRLEDLLCRSRSGWAFVAFG